MSPGSYTELFFLDEAVALAAGHRPCAECRHAAYRAFQGAWAHARLGETSAEEMDRRIHADRLCGPRTRRTYHDEMDALPDGTYVEVDGAAWLVRGGAMHAWSPAGYTDSRKTVGGAVTVITPRCLVDVLRAGYRPGVHPSIG